MKKIVVIATLLVAAIIAAYAYHLNSLLAGVANLSGANLHATAWYPSTRSSEERVMDLGYAVCSLPSDISGELQRVEDSMFICLVAADKQPQVTFCPPVPESDADVGLLIKQTRAFGIQADTMFDLKKRALATMPFTLIDGLRWGRTKVVREATLLTFKALTFPADSEVRFFESDLLGMFIYSRQGSGMIDLYDKHAGVSQVFLVPTKDLLRIADVLATSYKIVGSPKTSTDLETMLTEQRLPQISFSKPNNVESLGSEAERLAEVADEIKRRRASRN
ncbi:MAG: hypothetical protein C0518_00080 [Opitutus sp.]|nr:hypothetical protein [Opitutus sp.]